MKAHQLRGLKNIFDQSAWSTHDLGVENCRGICYSDLNCQYWQYFTGTGCWVETVDHMMPYPLSFADDSVRTYDDNSGASGDLKDGEFIQHYCTVTTTTTTITQMVNEFGCPRTHLCVFSVQLQLSGVCTR